MKTTFICLANSKKYGERCIAGIEVINNQNFALAPLLKNDKPKWVRPITMEGHGQVPGHLVSHIELLQVVQVEVLRCVPLGYQSENILFDPESLCVLGKIKLNEKYLDLLIDAQTNKLFGNRAKAVSAENIGTVETSLVLIKVERPEFYMRDDNQLRAVFRFNYSDYNLPVTDVNFMIKYLQNPNILDHANHIYFTVSLGIEFEGFHYKLVAGVVWL